MAIMFYDSIISGHHSEYIKHLIDYLESNKESAEDHYFVVPKVFQEKFGDIVADSLSNSSVKWVFIDESEIDTFSQLPRWKRSFVELRIVKKYAESLSAREVFLMYFDSFEIALMFSRTNFFVSGILFIQLFRLNRSTIKEKLRYYKKVIYTKLYLLNSKLKKVLILNDITAVKHLNNMFNTNKFAVLVDPIPSLSVDSSIDIYNEYSISKTKKILIHPGSISFRKGTIEIIDSIKYLTDKEKNEIVILIVGYAKADIDQQLKEKIQSLGADSKLIIYENSFISDDKLGALFRSAYAVLIPYKNVESSSGILGHAAKANKPLLAPSGGLLGSMVREFELGVTIDKINSTEIAEGIRQLFSLDYTLSRANEFTRQRTPRDFSQKILSVFD